MDEVVNLWGSLQRKIQAWRASSSASSSVNFPFERPEQINDHVYQVHKPEGHPSIEVVFFHGLQFEGSQERYLTTWLSAEGNELWLKWILEDVPNARILLVSYVARMDMYQTCENLVASLTEGKAKVGGDDCPVILVGHFIGGLVIKELCVQLHSTVSKALPYSPKGPAQNLLHNIRGIFFYACPHLGSRLADTSSDFPKGPLFEGITALNKEAQRRNQKFRELLQNYGWKTCGIGEGRPTTLGLYEDFIVSEASARCDVDEFFTYDGDHFDTCRPRSRNSSNFTLLSNFLANVLGQSQIASIGSEHSYASTSRTSIPELDKIRDTIYYFYRPPDDPKAEPFFIIFFHDIHWTEYEVPYVQTWMSRCGKICWPQAWLKLKYPDAHILSARYDAGTMKSDTAGRMDLYQIAECLRHDILSIYTENCPIYLVGHGLGGLVIKELVNQIQTQFDALHRRVLARKQEPQKHIDLRKIDSFLKKVNGVCFYAAPFLGMRLVDSIKHLPNRGSLTEPLEMLSEKASRINESFRAWRHDSNCDAVAIFAGLPTKVAWYAYLFGHQQNTQVVEEGSGRYDVDYFYTSQSNHFDVCKPCNEVDSSFQRLIELIDRKRSTRNMDSTESANSTETPC